jgi:hypothetical protein
MCNIPFLDAGSIQISGTSTVQGDGSVTGSETITQNFTFAGMTMMSTCTYSFTGTKR